MKSSAPLARLVSIGLPVALLIAIGFVTDEALFAPAEQTPLYRETLDRAYSRFKESNVRIVARGNRHGRRSVDEWADPRHDSGGGTGEHDHAGPIFQRGQQLMDEKNYAAAIETYEGAFAEHADCALARHKIADCRWELGELAEAINLYREVLKKDPDYLCVWEHLGDIFREKGDAETGQRMDDNLVDGYRRMTRRSGRQGYIGRFNLAAFWIKRGRNLDEALTLADEIAHDAPETHNLELLARCHEERGENDKAVEVIRRVIETSPELTEKYEGILARLDKKKSSKLTQSSAGEGR